MKLYKLFLLLLLGTALVFTACDGGDDPEPDNNNNQDTTSTDTSGADNTVTPVNNPSSSLFPGLDQDAVGTLVAMKLNSETFVNGASQGNSQQNILSATFWDPADNTVLLDAGTVSTTDYELTRSTFNNGYSTTLFDFVTLTDPQVLNWSVSGGNGIPAIAHTHTHEFPKGNGISLASPMVPGQPLTINYDGFSNFDLLVVQLNDENGNQFMDTQTGNPTSATIPGSETQGVVQSNYIASVLLINFDLVTLGGEKFYFMTYTQFNQNYVTQ